MHCFVCNILICFFTKLFSFKDLHEKIKLFAWSEVIQQILTQYKLNVTEHCFNLVADGYTSIKLNYLANILGM